MITNVVLIGLVGLLCFVASGLCFVKVVHLNGKAALSSREQQDWMFVLTCAVLFGLCGLCLLLGSPRWQF